MVLFLFIPFILGYIIKRIFFSNNRKSITQRHVVITGGSSGIGKSLAVLAAKQGAHVTIIARNMKNINLALADIKQACVNVSQKIQGVSLDVTDYKAVEQKLNNLDETVGPIYMLVNCAGMSICGKLEDLSIEDFKTLMDINYMGTVYPTKVVVPKMKQRKEGIIVITASQAALLGVYGFSAYSASKFALRGFAEALDMELHGHNISVTVALPPDTDTPGFENENKTKPEETALISKTAGLFNPFHVAKVMLDDALDQKFFSSIGFESYILTTLCVGMTRFSSVVELLVQAVLLGPIRVISSFYLTSFHRIIKNCQVKQQKNK